VQLRNHNYEKLEFYKRSVVLAVSVLKKTKDLRPYALADQMSRAAISIASNIAEGSERNSDKEFIRFLNIASGSCSELRTQMKIQMLLEPEDGEEWQVMSNEAGEINAMMWSFKSSLGSDKG
jgi:four helix bundle protein